MKIIIDISQYDYDSIIADIKSVTVIEETFKAIKKGVVLPPMKIIGNIPAISKDETIVDTDCLDEDARQASIPYTYNTPKTDSHVEADTPKRIKGTPLEENDSGYNCENWIP